MFELDYDALSMGGAPTMIVTYTMNREFSDAEAEIKSRIFYSNREE